MKKYLFFAILLLGVFTLVQATCDPSDGWCPPTTSPPYPAGSVPLNTGSVGQTKSGWLNLGSESTTGLLASDFQTGGLGLFFSGLGVRGGNFLLATSTPALGKVLMSTDDFGIAAWVATSTLGLGGGGAGYWTQTQAATGTAFLFPTATTTSVGIGTMSPTASAILDLTSSTVKGFLPPRLTTVQRDAIVSPATGLIIFNTTTNQHESRTSAGWVPLGGGLVSKRVFVTSTTYNGNLGGLSGADSKCQERANAASLGGTWRAVLSTSSVNAKDRVGYSWDQLVNMQGGIVAWKSSTINGMQDLWDGVIGTPIKYDEFGGISTDSIWSGSNSSGVYAPDVGHQAVGDCYAWTSSVFGWGGKYGTTLSTTSTWIDSSFGLCNQLKGLYCIEQ